MLPTLTRARLWVDHGMRVTLLDTHRYLYYSGMVPEYLGGVYTQDEVRIDLKVLCEAAGVHFAADPVERLDPNRRMVRTDSGQRIPYDLVAFDVGARNPGVRPGVIQTKPLHHIEQLARRIDATLAAPDNRLRMVIAGGGAAGVEVGLNVAHRFAAEDRADVLDLTIVEQKPALLNTFPRGMQQYATRQLVNQGVTLRTGTRIEAVTQDGAHLSDGRHIPADALLWSTGSVGHPMFTKAGVPTDARDFVHVLPDLRPPGFPRVFVAGDCATVLGHESQRKVGVHAVKQGPVLRDNLGAALDGICDGVPSHRWALRPFRPYALAPLILSTGTRDGLWTVGTRWMHGRPLLRLKHTIDRRWIRPYNGAFRNAGFSDLVDAASASDAL